MPQHIHCKSVGNSVETKKNTMYIYPACQLGWPAIIKGIASAYTALL